MKHGWKTRIDERRYFEEKLAARKARIAAMETNGAYLYGKWIESFPVRHGHQIAEIPSGQPEIDARELINGKQWL